VCAMDEAIDIVWVCPPSFFIHFLLKKRKVFFFRLLFFKSLLFVRLCIRCSGWCYLRCMYYYTIFANRRYSFQALLLNATFLLRSNRLIDYFFSLCFRFPPLLRSTVALVVSVPVHLSFLERGDQGDEFSLFFFLLLQRLDFE
jgi:hypothetical protein